MIKKKNNQIALIEPRFSGFAGKVFRYLQSDSH